VSDIARHLGLTRQTVQETADAMARDGLVDLVDIVTFAVNRKTLVVHIS